MSILNIFRLFIFTLILGQLGGNLNGNGLTGDFGRRFGVNSQEMQEPLFVQERAVHYKNYRRKKCTSEKYFKKNARIKNQH